MADPSHSHTAIDRHKLDAFVARCLEPIESQITGEDVRVERSARKKQWHRAMVTTEYFRELHRAATVAYSYKVWTGSTTAEIDPDKRFVFLQRYREAVAEQLLAPAVTQADIKWKQSARKISYIPVDQLDVDAALAEDAAYMARRKLKGGNRG